MKSLSCKQMIFFNHCELMKATSYKAPKHTFLRIVVNDLYVYTSCIHTDNSYPFNCMALTHIAIVNCSLKNHHSKSGVEQAYCNRDCESLYANSPLPTALLAAGRFRTNTDLAKHQQVLHTVPTE